MIEFFRENIEEDLERVCREHSFQPPAHKLEITGYCLKCASRRGKRDRWIRKKS